MRAFILIFAAILILVSSNAFSQDDPYGIVDTVRVGEITAAPGETVDLDVYLFNDKTLNSLTAPLQYNNQLITIDTVIFDGSKVSHIANCFGVIDNDAGSLLLGAVLIQEDPIEAGLGVMATIRFSISENAQIGDYIPVDSGFIEPGGYMVLVTSDLEKIKPAFTSGGIQIVDPNKAPVFADIDDQYIREGDTLGFTLSALDPEESTVMYGSHKLPEGATINSQTGEFTWSPPFVGPNSSVGSPFELKFTATDGDISSYMTVNVTVTNKNRPPILTVPESVDVTIGDTVNIVVAAEDSDLEEVDVSVENLPGGADFRAGNPAYISWDTDLSDSGSFEIEISASDPAGLEDNQTVTINVNQAAFCELSIEDIQVVSGNTGIVDVNLVNRTVISSMNLLIKYDQSALTLLSVISDDTRLEDWEIFAPTIEADDGRIWLDARPNAPGSESIPPLAEGSGSIMRLNFYVSSNSGFIGMMIPVGFEFLDTLTQQDNILLDSDGDPVGWENTTFTDGSVFVKQMETLIGDINLNDVAFEVADLVYFQNYFINPSEYPLDGERWANSDINQDNRPGTVGDLVLLVEIVGEGSSGKILLDDTEGTVSIGVQSIESASKYTMESTRSLGAVFMEFETNSEPVYDIGSNSEHAEILSHFDGTTARLLILSDRQNGLRFDSGSPVTVFSESSGGVDLSGIEISDLNGNLLTAEFGKVETLPVNFSLGQNYPNPFNPSTTISFSIPRTEMIELQIYNIRGQIVRTLVNEQMSPGHHAVMWDGRDEQGHAVSSGVYLYRINAGDYSETRKMTLVK